MDKNIEKTLFDSKLIWDEGNKSDDNVWANWKCEKADNVTNPYCGSFEYWDSLDKNNSRESLLQRKVKWAEMVLWGVAHNIVGNSQNNVKKIDETEKLLFEAKKMWDEGNKSDDNFWANWKCEKADNVTNPHCGSFEYWDSLDKNISRESLIQRKVRWAEMVIWGANLQPSCTIVGGYFRNDGTYVNSHLRRI